MNFYATYLHKVYLTNGTIGATVGATLDCVFLPWIAQ